MKSPGRVFWPLASLLVLADCSTKRAIEDAVPVVGAVLLAYALWQSEGDRQKFMRRR
jgi:hypothetical protein